MPMKSQHATGLGPVLALIPARSGSKSVPRKNLRPLHGKPLIAYSIAHALACPLIDRVIVTTDSEEIATVARAFGAEAPFLRPAEISGDHALDIEFHRHALEWLERHEGYRPALVVNLRPTHPIRDPATLAKAIQAFAAAPQADCLRSVRASELSPYKMWRIGDDGYAVPVAPIDGMAEPYNMPRQLLPMSYWQDGYVDITRPEVVVQKKSTTGNRILPFLIDEQCVDIDYEENWAAAEDMLAGATKDRAEPARSPSLVRHPS
jgi:N-acylneuraminate cytidylyltransferase